MSSQTLCNTARLLCYSALDGHRFALNFLVRIDASGEVEFDLRTLPVTEETRFLLSSWDSKGGDFTRFSLLGIAEDGTSFETESLHFTSMNRSYSAAAEATLTCKARCSSAKFKRKLTEPTRAPVLRILMKGFRNFGILNAQTELGTVTMAGHTDLTVPNTLTGAMALHAVEHPSRPG